MHPGARAPRVVVPGRRNAVTAADRPWIAAVTVLATAAALAAGCHPTGNTAGDVLATAALAATATWLGATASWSALVLAGAAAAATGGALVPLALGVLAAAVGLVVGDRRLSLPVARAAGAGAAVNALLRLRLDLFFGASALVAGGALIVLIGISAQRQPTYARRVLRRFALALAGVALASVVAYAAAALTATGRARAGYHGLLGGLGAVADGDTRSAADLLHHASTDLAAAAEGLDGPWAQPVRLVPGAAQQQQAIAAIVTDAASAADAAADALSYIDFDRLAVQNGRIDVTQVAILAEPLDNLRLAVIRLQQSLTANDSPWLIAPLSERVGDYRRLAAATARQAGTLHDLSTAGPSLLGADGPRRYFVGFASPAEGRGLMGVMGNYAIVTIDNGVIHRNEFGRINTLRNELTTAAPYVLDVSAEFRERYGHFGAGATADSPVDPTFWSNVTMVPDMPTAGDVIGQLWQATRHQTLDGVILLDPAALAAMLAATGPIQVSGLDTPLESVMIERFLYLDQYQRDTPERRDMLEDVADATLDVLLGGSPPSPQKLVKSMSDAVGHGDVLIWSRDPAEESLIGRLGADGSLPSPGGADGLAIVTNNAVANKIDSFLERDVSYQADYDRSTDEVRATLDLTLHNTAPEAGLPSYVIGSEFLDVPSGTNRTILSIYSPLDVVGVTVDGEASGLSRQTELGWNVYSMPLDLASGASHHVVVELHGTLHAGTYQLVLRPQPMARSDRVLIDVGGDTHVAYHGILHRRLVLSEHGADAIR